MSFAVRQVDPQTAVIQIGKSLDFRNAAQFKQICQNLIRGGTRKVVLNFRDTGVLDSTGLGAIFSIYRQLTPLGGQIVFAETSRPVQVVVQLTRTFKVFKQYPSVAAALQNLQNATT